MVWRSIEEGLKGYMIRIYEEISLGHQIEIKDSNFHYLKNVRRLPIDSEIVVMNTEQIGVYRIESIGKKLLVCAQVSVKPLCQPKQQLTVYQCVLKRDFMDTVLEKLGEIGVSRVVPVMSSRTIGTVKPATLNRYKQLVRAGALQAEHDFLPEVLDPISLNDLDCDGERFYVFYERKQDKKIPTDIDNNVSLFIGPEGGISDEELKVLESKGGIVISPISSVLKAETASVIFAGMVKCMMESSGGI